MHFGCKQFINLMVITIAYQLLVGCESKSSVNTRRQSGTSTAVDAPLNVSGPGTAEINTPILITWETVSLAHSFDLIVGANGSCDNQLLLISDITSLSQKITLSQPGAYQVCIKAKDKNGKSIAVNSNTLDIVVAGFVSSQLVGASNLMIAADSTTGPHAAYDDDTTIYFRWMAASDSKSGIRDYTIKYYQSSACAGSPVSLTAITAIHYEFTSASPGSTYSFQIVSFNNAGESTTSDCSDPLIVDTLMPLAGGAGALSTSNIAVASLDLSWAKATDGPTAQTALQYLVYYSLSNNITTVNAAETNGTIFGSYTADIDSANVTGLVVNTVYYFNVVVKDLAGNKTAYVTTTATTANDTTDPTVGGGGTINSANISYTSLDLSWTKGTDDMSAPANLQYLVYYSTSNNIASVATAEANGTAVGSYASDISSKSVTGLTHNTSYYFNVIVKDEADNKEIYTTKSATTLADTTAPTHSSGTITTSSITPTSIDLGWTKATDNISLANTLQYLAYYSTSNNITTVSDAETNGTAVGSYATDIATKSITGLAPDTTYYFNVIVKDEAGNQAVYTSKQQATTNGAAPTFTSLTLVNAADDGYINDSESGTNLALATLSASNYDAANYAVVTSATTCDVAVTYGLSAIPVPTDIGSDGTYKICVELTRTISTLITYGMSSNIVRDILPPTATISGAPSGSSGDTALNVTVGGTNVTHYIYDLVDAANCSTASYSSSTAIATLITEAIGANGPKALCVRGIDAAGNTQATASSSSWTKLTNTAPTITWVEPNGITDATNQGTNFTLSWTDTDPDDNAIISMYYKNAATGDCITGTKIGASVTEDSDGADDTMAWDTTGVAIGAYYICARIEDDKHSPVDVWSTNAINIVTLSLAGPDVDYIRTSSAWSPTFTASFGQVPYVYSLPTSPSGASINSSTGVISYTPASTGAKSFVVRATDNGGAYIEKAVTLNVHSYYNCIWNGATNAWTTASNWDNCNSAAPSGTKRVVIPASAPNQPIISSNVAVQAFGPAPYGITAGGTVTVNAGKILTVQSSTESLASSVAFQGDTPACTTCRVTHSVLLNGFQVINNATLTLSTGIWFEAWYEHAGLILGDGVTVGHLQVAHGDTDSSHWPIYGSGMNASAYGGSIWVESPTATLRSSVDINGLRYNNATNSGMQFYANAHIKRMDNIISSDESCCNMDNSAGLFIFHDCKTVQIDDWFWDGLVSDYDSGINATYVDASDCPADRGPIKIAGSGTIYGAAFEVDPNNFITWVGATPSGSNVAPTVSLSTPTAAPIMPASGSSAAIDIVYSAADSDSVAEVALYYKVGSSSGCGNNPVGSGWTQIVDGLPEASNATYIWSGMSLASGKYYICATVDDSVNPIIATLAPDYIYVLSNMQLWLSADSGVTTTGTKVTGWTDKSGNSHDVAQASTSLQPTLVTNELNGKPAIRFDGTQSLLSSTNTLLGGQAGLSYLVVFSTRDGNADAAPLISRGAAAGQTRLSLSLGESGKGGTTNLMTRIGDGTTDAGAYSSSNNVATNQYSWAVLNYDGTIGTPGNRATLSLNGATSALSTFGTLPATTQGATSPTYIGADAAGNYFKGDIVEVMAFNATLSFSDLTSLGRYLFSKYGFTAAGFFDDFEGAALSGAWTTKSWQGGSAVSVNSGVVNVSGSQLAATGYAMSTIASFKFNANYGADDYLEIGIGTDFAAPGGNYWAAISTYNSTDTLHGNLNVNGTDATCVIGSIPGVFATYEIVKSATDFKFFINGTLGCTITNTIPGATVMKPLISGYDLNDPAKLVVDWINVIFE